MSTAEITALATGIPAIIAAVTGLVTALRAKSTATNAQGTAQDAHSLITAHTANEQYPIQPTEASQ